MTAGPVVGVDIAKDRLDVAVRPSGETWVGGFGLCPGGLGASLGPAPAPHALAATRSAPGTGPEQRIDPPANPPGRFI